jgi:hypothetical protein
MGIKDLISKVFPDDMKIESSFEVLKNKTMGVDVSNYMFKLVTMRDNLVRDFHCEPRLDISAHIYKFWDLFKKTCDNYSILIVPVLDGMRNPAKKDTNVLRVWRCVGLKGSVDRKKALGKGASLDYTKV